MEDKKVIVAASHSKEKFYINDEFSALPAEVQKNLRHIAVVMAEKIKGVFIIGFYTNGNVYFETRQEADELAFDEAQLNNEIAELSEKETELLRSLKTWYLLFMTKSGKNFIETFKNT